MRLVAMLLMLPASVFSISLGNGPKLRIAEFDFYGIVRRLLLLAALTFLFFVLVVWLLDFP